MKVENKVTPNEAQIKGFFESGSEGPIHMLNLLKFKDKADYKDGRETDLIYHPTYYTRIGIMYPVVSHITTFSSF